jgi:DNA gyrase subunit B
LLTFFYRQMRPLIERGHLYIAQPPLYKVKRGQSEVYLKDERAFEAYLLDAACADSTLKLGNGEMLAHSDFRAAADSVTKAKHALDTLLRQVTNAHILEQALFAGYVESASTETAAVLLKRLQTQEHENAQWEVAHSEENLSVSRTYAGVKETWVITPTLLAMPEARVLISLKPTILHLFENGCTHVIGEKTTGVHWGPSSLAQSIFDLGRKGISISRYKGLGEMNPEQLWQTTLDPSIRALVQVKLNHIEEAEEIFSTLMGDVVEPRREFIQRNALNVSNLDA